MVEPSRRGMRADMHREEREILEQSLLFLLGTATATIVNRSDDNVFAEVRHLLEMALLQLEGSE